MGHHEYSGFENDHLRGKGGVRRLEVQGGSAVIERLDRGMGLMAHTESTSHLVRAIFCVGSMTRAGRLER
jgi:hypothetical protein